MTPEQLAAAKSIVQHAAANSLETDEVMLIGHAAQEIDQLLAELDRLRDDVQRGADRERELSVMLVDRADELDRLRAELARLRSAPVAVEVPEMKSEDFIALCKQVKTDVDETGVWAGICAATRTTEWFRERIKIDSSRILKDGEREELEILRQVAKIIDDKRNAQWERRGAGPCQRMPDEIDNLLCDWYEIQAKREFDALRSGEAEGRMG